MFSTLWNVWQKEVMVPRQDVDCIFVEDGYDEAMKVIRSTSHTRYPLCGR